MSKCENISLIIDSVCKKQGIDYSSTNPHYVSLKEDATKMGMMYLELKKMIGILQEIETRHDLNGLRKKFEALILELDNADHILLKVAHALKDTNHD